MPLKRQIIISLALFFAIDLFSQSPDDVFKSINPLNSSALKNFLDKEVDLCIKDDQQFNSRDKAIDRLTEFISNNVIVKVEPLHNTTTKGKTSEYKVAKITTKTGVYRFFVYSELVAGQKKVKEIRIENFK